MDTLEDPDGGYFLALPKGTKLFEYRIESVLGQGGFGITYLANDTLLDEAVAIKEYFPNESAFRTRDLSARAKSPQDRELFQSGLDAFLGEARIIARFRHRNIMQVRRFFEAHGTAYIVLQFETGRSFEDVVADGPLPEKELMPIIAGILDGLEAVHERAILHRDIKPRNVIIRQDGTPVLIDFRRGPGFQLAQQLDRDEDGVARLFPARAIRRREPAGTVERLLRARRDDVPRRDGQGAGRFPAPPAQRPARAGVHGRGRPLSTRRCFASSTTWFQIDERERPATVADIRASLAPVLARLRRQAQGREAAAEDQAADRAPARTAEDRGAEAG